MSTFLWQPFFLFFLLLFTLHNYDHVKVLPLYLLQFGDAPVATPLDLLLQNDLPTPTGWEFLPGRHHRRFQMLLPHTTELWVGYLDTTLTDLELIEDVKEFLEGVEVAKVVVEKENVRRSCKVSARGSQR